MATYTNDNNEPSVDPGAFWHTNMDLYYGYSPGEVVEIEHEPNKYWLASIKYCFKQLVLLEWVGKYGDEFWIDTSLTNSSSNSSGTSSSYNGPKRLFPLGYHLGTQLKSKFKLEKPSKILNRPSLYNPSKDPYADIRTIEELLGHEIDDRNNDDAFAIKPTCDTAGLALAKCKTKINFGQEDQEELEAALLSLSGLEQSDESKTQTESSDPSQNDNATNLPEPTESKPKSANSEDGVSNLEGSIDSSSKTNEHDLKLTSSDIPTCGEAQVKANENSVCKNDISHSDNQQSQTLSIEEATEITVGKIEDNRNGQLDASDSQSEQIYQSDNQLVRNESSNEGSNYETSPTRSASNLHHREDSDGYLTSEEDLSDEEFASDDDGISIEDRKPLILCERLQFWATRRGMYRGVDATSTKFSEEYFSCKPKQIYDIGGANQERLFVPGTLLEVCHHIEDELGNLNLRFWIAFIVKNVGGRLTLRWFLHDEPKFKQGRLELKSSKSSYIIERPEQSTDPSKLHEGESFKISDKAEPENPLTKKEIGFSPESMTFSLHFCDPRIHTILHDEKGDHWFPGERRYTLPSSIADRIIERYDETFLDKLQDGLYDLVLDTRRVNLDKDRPLIDHALYQAHKRAPDYLDIDTNMNDAINAEILMSCPKMPKLLKANVKRAINRAALEIHSEPLPETGEILKFIYPFETSYAILPLGWAENHEECLSVDPSRNTSPSVLVESGRETNAESKSLLEDTPTVNVETSNEESAPPTQSTTSTEPNPRLKPSYFEFSIISRAKEEVERKFKVMDLIEVVHPSSDSTICLGRIRKVLFPLIWIQLSTDCYTLLPYNSTNIYPHGWCEAHNHKLVSLLPPRKRITNRTPSQCNSDVKRRKKAKTSHESTSPDPSQDPTLTSYNEIYEKEHFDLGAIKDRQAGIDHILSEKSTYIEIFFNHKCFTGPSLSKSKICSLPQYVGPGPMRLVIEEVVTKVISVAYVPPRILNDLSSRSFEELLIERNLTNTVPVEFKAKYQKRVHRDTIPVCVSSDDVALYCECICEHIKCCYNLFGLKLYDGDDCPSHCRSLTKSNKFMKRATYYREKARQGEFLNHSNNENNGSSKKNSNPSSVDNGSNSRNASRARYTGRGSSESTSSSNLSSSDQTISRSSPAVGQIIAASNEMKENSVSPEAWTVDDVARYLDSCQLGIFNSYMRSEGIDGQALLLLDKATIEEHFQYHMKSEFTQEEVNRLCQIVELIKSDL